MRKLKIAFAVVASVSFATSAVASVPKLSETQQPFANALNNSAPVQTASFANGCDDPNYAWYEYSGIEALTCLFSGQWT
ncbi:hypothetical protein SAMN03159496_05844 [Rhizobium sp. NFR07]|uniref:hypothetical protein n=1 Tax=Rhizobium sp. NFR07 TaxID=1566262 RepID=UPI0008EA6A1B|nr:hypothetical protein [Rhizobium sp. NFR07]SFB61560.1 hypothetical protein SAMN03159496_05844 [Rhizobium sp. NFR07]